MSYLSESDEKEALDEALAESKSHASWALEEVREMEEDLQRGFDVENRVEEIAHHVNLVHDHMSILERELEAFLDLALQHEEGLRDDFYDIKEELELEQKKRREEQRRRKKTAAALRRVKEAYAPLGQLIDIDANP